MCARAIEGWDEPVFNDGVLVGCRRRCSDALVRLALEHERATAAATWGTGARPAAATPEQTDASILRKLASMARQRGRQARAAQLAWCEQLERDGKAP